MVRYESPDDLRVGDTITVGDQFWARVVRTTRDGIALLSDPTHNDRNRFIRIPEPDHFEYEKYGRTVRLLNTGELLFVELVEAGSKPRAEMLPRSEWPAPDTSSKRESWTLPKPTRETPIEWTGTEQRIDGKSTRARSRLQREGDVRGTKNDLLKGNR